MVDRLASQLALELEQDELARSGRLNWMHWSTIVVAFVITMAASYGARVLIQDRAEQRFTPEADQIIDLFVERLERYEDALSVGVAAVTANTGGMTLSQWRDYAQRLDLGSRYPSMTALNVLTKLDRGELAGFIDRQRLERPEFSVFPAHDADVHIVVTYVTPEQGSTEVAGYDAAADIERRNIFLQAGYLNGARMTPPITIVSQQGIETGFVIAIPYYQDELDPFVWDRSRQLAGFMEAVFTAEKLVSSVLGPDTRHHEIRITDQNAVLYDDFDTEVAQHGPPELTRTRSVRIYGRRWEFSIRRSAAAGNDTGYLFPVAILVGGLTFNVLLLTFFVLLARANRRAVSFAEKTSRQLRVKAQELVAINYELESYAYVVSHDLKTPLRGIHDLASYIDEDLRPSFEQDDAHREAQLNLQRIFHQIERSHALIEGMLDYSGVGLREERLASVDVGQLVAETIESLPIEPSRVVIDGQLPVFETYEVRLGQVLANLVGNAFKYHHDPASARVIVGVSDAGEFYRFWVCDNGPGIEPRFHKRIFEAFKTLQSKDEIESTGVGLSIVKKSVELLGGCVALDSVPGEGTTIHFDWPKCIDESVLEMSRAA